MFTGNNRIYKGRKRNKGVRFTNETVQKVATNFGYNAEEIPAYKIKNDGYLTPNNVNQYLAEGVYILGCRGHVLALKNGNVEDWTNGRKYRITRIWKVEKVGKKVKRLTFDQEFKKRKSYF